MNSLDFLEWIVGELTEDKPDVSVVEDEHGAVFTVNVKKNVGQLLGKKGGTIDMIRILMKGVGYNGKHRIKVKINEQAKPQPDTRYPD